jgi:ubiquinone/menaquinone biosynthesis C-methylase UbiE
MTLADHVWGIFRARTVRWWYGYLGQMLAGTPIVCLNYGYALEPNTPSLSLSEDQESMRPYLQLYHRVAQQAKIRGKDLIEISCGYGGGAAYLQATFEPRTTTGLDASSSAIQRASSRFGGRGLAFLVGHADALAVPSQGFDILMSVEASHCYPDMARFLSEAYRVLRPGGSLVLADYRPEPEMARLGAEVLAAGFVLNEWTDITDNVIRSIEENHEQRTAWITRYGPSWLRPVMGQLAGVRGSIIHRSFVSGRMRYSMFRAVKA